MPLVNTSPITNMQAVRVARRALDLSQRELAQAAEISPWRLWRLEAGVTQPRQEEIAALWGALSTQERTRQEG